MHRTIPVWFYLNKSHMDQTWQFVRNLKRPHLWIWTTGSEGHDLARHWSRQCNLWSTHPNALGTWRFGKQSSTLVADAAPKSCSWFRYFSGLNTKTGFRECGAENVFFPLKQSVRRCVIYWMVRILVGRMKRNIQFLPTKDHFEEIFGPKIGFQR